MKKLMLIMAFVSGLTFMASAQQKGDKTPAQRAAHKTKVLQKKLNLSAAQTKQVSTILLSEATRMDSLKNAKGASDKQLSHAAHKRITLQSDQKLNAVLNPDQKKAYAGFVEEKKEKKAAKKAAKAAPAKS